MMQRHFVRFFSLGTFAAAVVAGGRDQLVDPINWTLRMSEPP